MRPVYVISGRAGSFLFLPNLPPDFTPVGHGKRDGLDQDVEERRRGGEKGLKGKHFNCRRSRLHLAPPLPRLLILRQSQFLIARGGRRRRRHARCSMAIKKPLSVGGLKMYGVSASAASASAAVLWMGRKRLSGQVSCSPLLPPPQTSDTSHGTDRLR